MCGIFGWVLNKTPKKATIQTVSSSLAAYNDTRGGHSWGFWNGEIERGLGDMADAPRDSMKKLIFSKKLMAHTRFATTGGVTIENCHPFKIGSIVGAHNGIVWNDNELNKKYNRNHPVDSMHIFDHIEGDDPLEEIEAYGAVEFYDEKVPDSIWVSRFNGGELAVVRTSIGYFWSSSKLHLKRALKFAGLKSESYKIEQGKLYSINESGVYDMSANDTNLFNISQPPFYSTGGISRYSYSGRAIGNWSSRYPQSTSNTSSTTSSVSSFDDEEWEEWKKLDWDKYKIGSNNNAYTKTGTVYAVPDEEKEVELTADELWEERMD